MQPFLVILFVKDSNKKIYSFCWSYGFKYELSEIYFSYMPQNKCDKLNATAHNSANSAEIDEYVIDEDEDGVNEPDIVDGSERDEV